MQLKNPIKFFFPKFIKKKKKSSEQKATPFLLNKRQKFVVSIGILSLGLFFSEHLQINRSGIYISLFLSIATSILFFLTNYKDIKENFSWNLFILPFFYSLAFGLFFSLLPARFLTRFIMAVLYAVGLYSVFLSQNIFTVAAIRTIALLASARTVSFIITIVTYFFLANVTFSLHLPIIITAFLIFVFSYFLISHSIWTHTLESELFSQWHWVLLIALCLFQVSLLVWFWPTTPTVIALFLTGLFYTVTGLSHVWFDKRLFRGVLWEYIWVAVIVLFVLFLFTSWNG